MTALFEEDVSRILEAYEQGKKDSYLGVTINPYNRLGEEVLFIAWSRGNAKSTRPVGIVLSEAEVFHYKIDLKSGPFLWIGSPPAPSYLFAEPRSQFSIDPVTSVQC